MTATAAWKQLHPKQQAPVIQVLGELANNEQFQKKVKRRLRGYKWQHVTHDHRHFLLFGQKPDGIAPKAWFDAAWKFIQRFRCNFGMFLTEAMLYQKVTIVGATSAPVAVSEEDQWFLEEYTGYLERDDGAKTRWRDVERLNVTNAQQLAALLADRIERGTCFEGGEISPPQ